MATIYQTDKMAQGQGVGTPSALYPQWIDFDTSVSPGANVGSTIVLAINDEIQLCWLPVPSTVEWYSFDLADMDGGAALVLSLRDGAGNVYQAGITTAQAGGRVTAVTAAVNRVGIQPATALTVAQSYMTLVVTTAAASSSGVAGRVTGSLCVRRS